MRVDGWRAAYAGLVGADLLASLSVTPDRVDELAAAIADPGPHDVARVAEHGATVVGMARLCPCLDDDLDPATTAELRALYVAPGT